MRLVEEATDLLQCPNNLSSFRACRCGVGVQRVLDNVKVEGGERRVGESDQALVN